MLNPYGRIELVSLLDRAVVNIGLRRAQKSLERGSPRSDCGWNVRDRNGDANIGLRQAQIRRMLNAGNGGAAVATRTAALRLGMSIPGGLSKISSWKLEPRSDLLQLRAARRVFDDEAHGFEGVADLVGTFEVLRFPHRGALFQEGEGFGGELVLDLELDDAED